MSGTREVSGLPGILGGAVLVGFLVTAVSCTAEPMNPSVEISAAGSGGASLTGTPTPSTVTVTATVTTAVTTTATLTRWTTVTAAPTVTVTARPRPVVTSRRPFDQARTIADLGLVISDIRALDADTQTGPVAAARFDLLSRHYGLLLASAAPPGLDPPSWYGRVTSLQLFSDAAADEAVAGSPQSSARFVVIREETSTLLAMANGAMRTSLTLPPPPTQTS